MMMRGFRIQGSGVRESREPTTRRHRPFVERRLGPFPAPRPLHPAPCGLTLIELLITITIIATLAAMFLGASNAAMESARSARTKTTISKIHTLLMERWDSYSTRRVDFNQAQKNALDALPTSTPEERIEKGRQIQFARLTATRELMKMEMPDRWSDVLLNDIPNSNPLQVPANNPIAISGRPSLATAYIRAYRGLPPTKKNGAPITDEDLRRNQGAECLYLVIMLATGDGEARTVFSKQDIGDDDGDGALEFHDGWGRPIEWLRWPAGFASDIQPLNKLGNREPDIDHDPFDPFRVDDDAFRMVPLVYSPGPDGIFDVSAVTEALIGTDPYATAGSSNVLLGTQRDGNDDGNNWADNVHNHLQDSR